jgi:DNA-binding transcriptional ArsR family regulator
MTHMDFNQMRPLADILKDKNIVLKGADAATQGGFTQVPNFLLKSKHLTAGDKITFAMLLSYAWQNDFCFPGQTKLATDLGLHETNVRKHLKSLQTNGMLTIIRRGQGKTNIYELNFKPRRSDRAKTLGLDRAKRAALERAKTLGTP